MTIMATAPVPVFNRLDVAATLTQLLTPAPITCPAWCVDGPHEPFPTDITDEGDRLHSGAETVLFVDGNILDQPVGVAVMPQWLQNSAEAPAVLVTTFDTANRTTEVMHLSAEQAELFAAELLAAAAKLRTIPGGA